MPGEIINPSTDDTGIKKPLQKSDLMSATQADNPDYQQAKERYTRQLAAILNTPLLPENFDTYTEDALNSVIAMVGDMTATYPGESLPIPRGSAEGHTTSYYEMGIDDILDSLQKQVDKTKQIKDFVSNLGGKEDDVFVPPQPLQSAIQAGNGEFSKKETKPKLETILFLLQERYGLDIKDPTQVVVTEGSVTPGMMRKEPYYRIELPELNRTILVCNEVDNITYVMDSEELDGLGIGSELLVDFDKSQIDQLILTHPALGVRVTHTGKYIPKIELAIESIEDFATKTEAGIDKDADIVDESLLTPEVEAAPEGYMNASKIAKELKVGRETIIDIIAELGGLTPVKAKSGVGGAAFDAYSPEDIERIRKLVESRRLLTPAAPEGYMSARRIAKGLGVSRKTITDIIKELGGLTPIEAKYNNQVTNAYSPEDIANISEVAESRGLLAPEAPEGYKSAKGIAKELRLGDRTIKDIIKGLGGLTPIDAKFGGAVTEAYSPEAIATIREIAESRGLLAPEAPEGYMNASKIAKELRASRATITDIIKGLGGLTPIDAKFSSSVTDTYSPEDIERIRVQLRINRENKS